MKRPSYFEEDAPQPAATRRVVLGGLGAAAGLGGAAVAGYGAHILGLLKSPPETERITGCILGAKRTHSALALIDVTDPLTEIHAGRLRAALATAAKALPDYGWLGVFVLNHTEPAAPRQIFGRCAPRSPERTPPMEGGQVYLRQEWERTFEKPLLTSLEEVIRSTERAPRSPIIASIAALPQRSDFDASVPQRRLIVISDMLEHDPAKNGYSHLRGGDLAAAYRRSALASVTHADLGGVRVSVDYLQRPEPEFARLQTQAHRDFWRWWFLQAGAREVVFSGVRDTPTAPAAPVADARK